MFGVLLVPGVVLGALQLLVLRTQVTVARTWVLVTALGWAVGWAFGMMVGLVVALVVGAEQLSIVGSSGPGEPWSGLVMFGIGGAIAGLAMGGLQGTVLPTHATRSVVWVLASAVAMAVGGVFVGAVMWWGRSHYYAYNFSWSAVTAALLYGVITGYGLMLLLRQSGDDASDSTTEHASEHPLVPGGS